MIIINYYPVQLMRQQIISTKESEMLTAAGTLAAALEGFSTLTEENVYSAVSLLEVMRDRRILVTDAGGVVIFDSSKTSAVAGRLAVFPEVISALSGRDVFRCRYSETAFESCAAMPVMRSDAAFGAVYFYDYDTDQALFLRQAQGDLLRLSLGIAAVCVFGIAAFMLIFSRRLGLLLRGVKRVGQGDYDYQIDMGGGQDELADIAGGDGDIDARYAAYAELCTAVESLYTNFYAAGISEEDAVSFRGAYLNFQGEVNKIEYDDYRAMARAYNRSLEGFPASIVAGLFGLGELNPF